MPARCQPPHGNNDQEWWPYNYNTAIFSDDGGTTWQTAAPVQSGTGEGTLAELSNGDIYYNSRSHTFDGPGFAAVETDEHGHAGAAAAVGVGHAEHEHVLAVGRLQRQPDQPGVDAVARLPTVFEVVRLAHLAQVVVDAPIGEHGAAVVAEGDSPAMVGGRLVYEGPSAYSSLAAGPDGTIYLLFERGDTKLYEHIAVVRMNLDWIRE